ncbi:MAG: CHAT domain-containing protein, partial [Proteobacteria bacterium]|nr:CHAT domain-containing protein [Pseudomonadota bacterium]
MFFRIFFFILCVTNAFASQKDQNFYQQGNFAQAIPNLEQAITQLQPGSTEHFNANIRLAIAYQKSGNNYTTAYDLFQQALTFSKKNTARQILVHSYLGDLLLVMQQSDEAITLMEKHLETARSLGDSKILVNFLNNLGNAFAVEQYYKSAFQMYQEAIEIAQRIGNQNLYVQTLLNQLRLDFKLDSLDSKKLTSAVTLIEKLPSNYDQAFYLLNVGELSLHTNEQQAHKTLSQVLVLAKKYKNNRLLSYAKGFLSKLYKQQHRYDDALSLTREAIFSAQNEPDILYIWETQLGHIMLDQKNLVGALTAYKQALEHLQLVRQKLSIGQHNSQENFYQHIRPIYYGIADILLQQAQLATDKKDLLIQARDTIEQLKEAELQDYFQDECISAVKSKIKQLDNLGDNTAVFYPILLENRIELLINIGEDLKQFVIPVSHAEINTTVLEFRTNLQRITEGSFIIQAKQLFQWLIAPVQEEFDRHKINTLIIVPDGILRTIPMSALYNSNQKNFLFQQFALVTTPSLRLTDPHKLPRKNIHIMLNGLSDAVQGFTPLPNVVQEIEQIDNIFDKGNILLNKEFLLETVSKKLQTAPYEIIHISSHGQFDRNPKKSFLLTYDGKLTMDRLEKLFKITGLRKNPVELLTLSACQTAVGDE